MNESNQSSLTVRRRDQSVVAFDRKRIERAITLAFLRDANGEPRFACGDDLLPAELDKVMRFTEQVVHAVSRRPDSVQHPLHIEDIQDLVELTLMRNGEHEIARDYVLYRESRRLRRTVSATACSLGDGPCEACQ